MLLPYTKIQHKEIIWRDVSDRSIGLKFDDNFDRHIMVAFKRINEKATNVRYPVLRLEYAVV